MDPLQTTVFILFYLTNVISGASLGNKPFNETLDAEEEQKTVPNNIKKYEDEFRNYEMADIQNLIADFMPPVKKERKTIYTSKTYLGSEQFSGAHERSKDNSHHQTWDLFRANRVIGLQPSLNYPDDLFQQYLNSKNNHEASYYKNAEDNASDFPSEIKGQKKSEDKFPFSGFIGSTDDSPKDQLNENFHLVDGTKNMDELPQPLDDNTQGWVDDDTEDQGAVTSPTLDDDTENEADERPRPLVDDTDTISDFIELVKKNFDKASVPAHLEQRKIEMDEFQGSGDMGDGPDEVLMDTRLEDKSGRIMELFFRVNNTAECTTPKGERGRCRSLSQCPLSEPLTNFNLFLQYACLSRGVLVGICCPDNPVVEISDHTENSTGTSITEFKQPIDGCGLNGNTRIVGGKLSLPHEWTWMVALMRRNRFFCGGVIINDWYILTAAHCVLGIKVKDLKVRLGEFDFNEKNEHQQDIPVTEIKRHALFVTITFLHDIALLKLKRRIEYTKFVGSICLPNPKSGNFSNVNATVVGWGTEAFGGTSSPVLRQVTVPVWDNDECDKMYRLERITNAFMCAGSPENGEDACQGDSGGPLMVLNEGRWEVIGIVSWGRRCGDPMFPGVYTRVTSYLDWITENAN